MQRTPMMLLAGLLSLSVGALGCGPKKPTDGSLISGKVKTPEYFRYIPADTPYVLANMAPMPYDQLDWDVYGTSSQSLTTLRQTLDKEMSKSDASSRIGRVTMALVHEFDGNMNKKGLEARGLTLAGHTAIYGIGPFPVMRLGLADGAKFEAMVARVEQKSGVVIPKKTLKGISYREYRRDDAVIAMAVTDREVIVGMTHEKYADEFLQYAFGLKKPAKSMYEDNKIRAMLGKHGWAPYGAGYVDIEQIVNVLSGKETGTMMAQILKGAGAPLPPVDEVCRAEYAQIASTMPRLVFGYKDLTRNSFAFETGLELTGEPLKIGQQIQAPVPGYEPKEADKALATFGLGINAEQVVNVLTQKAVDIQANPYKCKNLQEINRSIAQAGQSTSNLPPLAQSLRGALLELRDLDIDVQNQKVVRLQAMALVRTTDPKGLFDLLKSLAPPLANASLSPDTPPVTLPYPPTVQAAFTDIPAPQIAMGKDSLGVSVGEGMLELMRARFKAPGSVKAIQVYGYDLHRIVELIRRRIGDLPDEEAQRIIQQLTASYDMFGPTQVKMGFTDKGVMVNMHAVIRGKKKAASK